MKATVAIEDCVNTISAPTSTVGCTALSPLPNPTSSHLMPTSPTLPSDEENALGASAVSVSAANAASASAVDNVSGSWLCCMPCSWLRGHDAVRQSSLVAVTLLVTSLLVASPVLFLISGTPSREQHACRHTPDVNCPNWPTSVMAEHSANMHGYCLSSSCNKSSARLEAYMDPLADPCEDFYKYACGKWLSDEGTATASIISRHGGSMATLQQTVDRQIQGLLEAASSDGRFSKLGDFYNSCLHAGDRRLSTAPLFALLDELGGYRRSGEHADVTGIIADLIELGGTPLFTIYADRDSGSHSGRPDGLAIYVDLPVRFGHGRSIMNGPRRTYQDLYREMEQWTPNARRQSRSEPSSTDEAFSYIKSKAEERRLLQMERLLRDFLPDDMGPEQRVKESHAVLLVVAQLTKALPREKEMMARFQDTEEYTRYNISRLQTELGFVNWTLMFTRVFNTSSISDKNVIYVVAPYYMVKLQALLSKFEPSVVHNALLLTFATDSLLELVNVTATSDWPVWCAKVTTHLFPKAVGALYVAHFTPGYLDDLRHKVWELVERLKRTLIARLRSLPWLNERSRTSAIHKISELKGRFIAEPVLHNKSYVDALLNDDVVEPNDFFGNVIRRHRTLRKVSIDFRSPPPSRAKWAYPFVVNAFYDATVNTIGKLEDLLMINRILMFPLHMRCLPSTPGYLDQGHSQPIISYIGVVPLAVLSQAIIGVHDTNLPKYMTMSSMGVMLAHELLHALDGHGSRVDAEGRPVDWLGPKVRPDLEKRLNCVAHQFDTAFSRTVRFRGANLQVQFDWNLTRNENMADIGGLEIAYDTWRHLLDEGGIEDLRLPGVSLETPQCFFLSAVQTYCTKLSPEYYVMSVEVDYHTPIKERMNGMMMNSKAFAKAFKCPSDSPMNPEEKCSIW